MPPLKQMKQGLRPLWGTRQSLSVLCRKHLSGGVGQRQLYILAINRPDGMRQASILAIIDVIAELAWTLIHRAITTWTAIIVILFFVTGVVSHESILSSRSSYAPPTRIAAYGQAVRCGEKFNHPALLRHANSASMIASASSACRSTRCSLT